VVVDETQWGFIIGEVEIIVHDPDHIKMALERIDRFSNEMGKVTFLLF